MAEDGSPNLASMAVVQVPEGGIFEHRCNRGHQTFTVVQNTKFELLADMAIRALVEEDYRGAISNFAASLERLYDFFTTATLRKHGVKAAATDKGRKSLRLSERQLGAFVTAYMFEVGEAPDLLDQKLVKLRNDVVHGGKLAGRPDAIKFGKAVCACAAPVLARLDSEPYQDIVQDLTAELMRSRRGEVANSQYPIGTGAVVTLFSPRSGPRQVDLEREIAEYARRPDLKQMVEQARAFGAFLEKNDGPSAT
ncbi:hypothetical protein RZN05_07535 [Sphingomonas sp. HF-S4]|uniref:Apea-like HEPN domain-containing protein n=1 Tax=Sphingomonas agrestis TaxID=3080540 RepID=A0ABU3Y603_9SPHN|nr:hypothetical protein [Sphingomonas sp. HF-S4]MDV3456829.1 hypothetical protein [Sphingomonas sp. HF-S4]